MLVRSINIRGRLSLQFIWIVASILLVFSVAVYKASETYHRSEFFGRLETKAFNTARLLIEVNEVDYNLLKILDRNTIQAMWQEKVVIYDNNNQEVYNSLDDDSITIDKKLLENIRNSGKLNYTEGDRQVVGLKYSDVLGDFVVIASAYDKYGESKLANLRIVLFSGFLIGLLVVGAAGWFFSGKALKPISKLIDEVDSISGYNLKSRVGEGNGTDELAQLAIRFNKMLERLEAAFELQRSFISTASHELRTPLTAITGEIEVTLLKSRPEEDYRKALMTVLEEVQDLTRLTNGLLQLANAENDFAKIKLETIRIDDLLWDCSESLRRSHPQYSIQIHFESKTLEDESKLSVTGNPSLVRTALLNVMENGCKYSQNHSVQVFVDFTVKGLSVRFVDQGVGIDAHEMSFIFEPFFRSHSSSQMAGGHGIGLPLTKRIMDAHQGEIHIRSEAQRGTEVELLFTRMAVQKSI